MKNSGVEWIGEIPEGWEVVKFKNLHSGTNVGESIDKDFCSDNEEGFIFYTAGLEPIHTSFTDFPLWKYTKENDLLLARNGTPYVYFPLQNAVYSDHIIRVSINNNYSKSFVKYAIEQSISNTVVDTVSIATWSASLWNTQKLPLPPKSIQQRIAAYLDKKCSKIEETIQNQQQVIEKLKAYKQSLITEVVTGKIKIQNGKVCGKYENYKDSGVEWIGKIPSEWEVGKTGMFTYVTKLAGFEFTDIMMDKISENGDVPIVRAQNVRMFKFNKEIINEYIDLSTSNTLNRCCLDKKCLLITFIGAGIGDVCIFNESIRYHLAPNVAKIEIRNFSKTKLCEEFLMYYIGSEPGKREIANISKAAAQPSLSMETIRKIKLCIPPFEEQKEIADYLEKKCTVINTSIEQKQNLIEKLIEYKKSLIYECVTGKKEI